jgi:hypothetical protein
LPWLADDDGLTPEQIERNPKHQEEAITWNLRNDQGEINLANKEV